VTSILTLLEVLIIGFFCFPRTLSKIQLAFCLGFAPKTSPKNKRALKSAASGLFFWTYWGDYTFLGLSFISDVYLNGSEVFRFSYESLLTFLWLRQAGRCLCGRGLLFPIEFGSRAVASTALNRSGICCLTFDFGTGTISSKFCDLSACWFCGEFLDHCLIHSIFRL